MSPPPLLAIPDEAMVDAMHADLQQTGVLPGVHLLDSGYVTSRTLTTSKERFGVEVIGPPPADQQWQAHGDQGIDVTQFAIDWDQKPPTCPQGHTSRSWTSFVDSRHNPLIKVQFSTTDCGSCPVQDRCIHSERKYKRRTLTLRPQAQHEALQRARRQQRSPTVVSQYHLREGVEATISPSEFGPLACAALVMSGRLKPTFSMSASLLLSTCVASSIGLMALALLLLGSPLFSASSLPPEKVYQQCQIRVKIKLSSPR
jgi:Transposase DDE domain